MVNSAGQVKEVLAAGHIRLQQLVVDIHIWDEEILQGYYAQVAKMGRADRMLYDTNDMSNDLRSQEDMLQMAPSAEELRELAAKGKSKKEGGKGLSEEQQKGDKGGGKDGYKGKKQNEDVGGGKIPAWNPGKGSSGSNEWLR